MSTPEQRIHRFGPFVLDVGDRRLLRDGAEVTLRARAFDVLVALVERAGRLVTKDELLDTVWSELAVEENNLQVQVSALRRALGPGWIATVPGRGYRFTGDTAAPAPEPAPDRRRSALPEPAGPLLGREHELPALLAHLRAHRLVTLTGPGGIGKTRLAQEAARALTAGGASGAWVDLAAWSDPGLVLEGIASSLGMPPGGEGPSVEGLVTWLRERDLLIVLDNAEHVLEVVAPLAARLLAHAPGVRMLVTSQVPCRVAGEQVQRLGALDLPDADAGAEAAAASGAVALFVARARALVGDFRLDARNVAMVVGLCRGLDGVPLALELAAGRLPAFGLGGLGAALEQRFRLLTGGDRAGPARQRTLEALYDWSYDLLGAQEQQVFRRLGLLAPGFTLADAATVATDDELDAWAVAAIVGDLVDRSLIVADAGDPPTCTLLETGRTYARAKLDTQADAPHVERAIRLYLERGAEAAARSDNAGALRACSAALDLITLLPAGRARDTRELELCLAVGPVIQTSIGPAHPRAEAVYRRATALAEALGPGEQAFMAQWGLWQFLGMSGRDREAAALSGRIVDLGSRLGDPALELEAHHARMTTAQLLGRAREVVESARRVIGLYDRDRHHALTFRFGGHDPGVCALGQGSIGLWLTGRPDEALAMATRALELGATMDHAYSRAVALFYPAFTWGCLGDREAFRSAAHALFELCTAHAMDMLSNEALLLRGRARWEAGDASGIADMERALDTIDAGGDYAFALFYAALLVEPLVASGRLDDAAGRLDHAKAYARGGQRFFLPEVLRWRGEIEARRAHPDRAAQAFAEARTAAIEDGATALALRAATSAAACVGARGFAAAAGELRTLLEQVQGGVHTADVVRARRVLNA